MERSPQHRSKPTLGEHGPNWKARPVMFRQGTCAALDANRVEGRSAMPAFGIESLHTYPALSWKWNNQPGTPVVIT